MDRPLELCLLAERASLSEASLTTGGLAQNVAAGTAEHNGLGVREDSGDLHAAGALDVHEEAVGSLDQSLELVLASLVLVGRVEEIVFQDGHGVTQPTKSSSLRDGVRTQWR